MLVWIYPTKKHALIFQRTISDTMKRILFGFGLLLMGTYGAVAQTSSCAQTLRLARSTYEQGRLHEIPTLLENCIKNGFTDQEKADALKLLTQTYIYLEEPEKADQSMLNLLETDHYFEINEAIDPAEFIALYRTFRTEPIYRLGAKVGVNLTAPNFNGRINVIDGTGSYTPKINFQTGASFEIPFTQKFTINPELYFRLNSFFGSLSTPQGVDQENVTEATESMRWISIPIRMQYKIFEKSRINPYISAGFSADYLLGSNVTIDRIRIDASPVGERSLELTPQREKISLNLIASAGVKLRLGGGFFVGELSAFYGITDTNSVDTSFNNSSFALEYGYGDSVFKLNSMVITIGYIQNIFNPKKLAPTQ